MIAGIDARELEGKATGVGVYLKQILQRISLPSGVRMLLFFRREIPAAMSEIQGEPVLLESGGSNLAWQQWTLCREAARHGARMLFSPANSLPWRFRGFQTLTVHDLSFFRNPEWFAAREGFIRRWNTRLSLRRADRIYTVSEYVKQELVSQFRIPERKILVTPNGIIPRTQDSEIRERLRQRYGIADDRIILYVGSIFNRRHIPRLVESMKHLDASCRLVVIGENRTHPRQDLQAEASRHGVADRVQLLEYAPADTVEDYYRMADVFVYLSEYEGFGIPPLEAMSWGVPAVVSDTPAMNTIFSGAAEMVKELRAETIADSIRSILTDSELRERIVQAGSQLAARSTWEKTADLVARDWEQILATLR